jgi:hypothetical protein
MKRSPSRRTRGAARTAAPSFEGHLFPLELEEIFEHRAKLEEASPKVAGRHWRRDRAEKLAARARDRRSTILEVAQGSAIRRATRRLFEVVRLSGHGPDSLQRRLRSRFKGVRPSVDLDLVGLALSGGGIRSATFNLGVVQALARRGIFRQLDYLSTVSGGGYLGSCLSSLLNRAKPGDFPIATDGNGLDRAALRKLRNSSKYLATGLVDLFRIPALLLRGILVNFAVLLPYLVATVWLTYLAYGERLAGAAKVVVFYGATLVLAVAFAAWSLLMPAVVRIWAQLAPRLSSANLATDGFRTRNRYERTFAYLLIAVVAVALVELALTGLSAGHHLIKEKIGPFDDFEQTWWYGMLSSGVAFVFAGKASAKVGRLRGKIALIVLGLLGPFLLFWIYLYLGQWAIYDSEPGWARPLARLAVLPGAGVPASWEGFSLIAAALFLYATRFVDVNATSLHSFYRDRLSRAYLVRLEGEDPVHADHQLLSELNQGAEAPYHLINATVNLPSSRDPELRGRDADFFLFSKHFVGGQRTGYCSTLAMERVNTRLDLGTAMAVSGAAAAPHMGSTTIKPLAFLMALLNVRLGYWLQNPRRVHEHPLDPLLPAGVGPWYLLRELLGSIDERSRHVNVSDGGHIENLGIYELLRRRCRYIVACDAEADPLLTFGGLAKLIRYARIDLGVEIDIHLDEVRIAEAGYSRSHCALAKVYYPPLGGGEVEVGHLLYIKASVTGEEPEAIREYRARNVDFPHETTADQFFDEAQFESYRELGHHVAAELFRSEEGYDLDEWFEELEETLRSAVPERAAFLELQKELGRLEADLASDEALAAYSYQLFSEIDAERAQDPIFATSLDPQRRLARGTGTGDGFTPSDPVRFRKIFHFCSRQLQLMENALLTLGLDRPENREHHVNRGWMNLFHRWAAAPYFRATWGIAVGTHSRGFQRFCKEELGLDTGFGWQRVSWVHLSPDEQRRLRAAGYEGSDFGAAGIGPPDDRGRHVELWLAEVHADLVDDRKAQIFSPGTGAGGPPESRAWFEWFPVGCAVFRLPGPGGERPAELLFYRVRSTYRKMRLFERMLENPPEPIAAGRDRDRGLRVVVSREHRETIARHAYLFERHGYSIHLADSKALR